MESLGNARRICTPFAAIQMYLTQAIDRLKIEIVIADTPIREPTEDGHQASEMFGETLWRLFRKRCEAINLTSAIKQLARIEDELELHPGIKRSQLLALFEELRNRLEDELQSRMFLYVENTVYWENETLFGSEVFDKIWEATDDIYEAGSCFAVGRAGGTIYHCMGIMQAVLFKIGNALGCTINLDIDYWGTVTQTIRGALDVRRKQAEVNKGDIDAWAEWKRLEASYNELLSDLGAVEKAWRHPSAHHRQTYTIAQAEKVLDKVKDFAQHAATLLP